MLLPAARLLLRALLRYPVLLLTPLGLLRCLLRSPLRLLLDALLLLLWLLRGLHARLRRLLDPLLLLPFLLLRRLLLHSLLWLLRLLRRRLLRALRALLLNLWLRPLLDLGLRLCPLRLRLLHSRLLRCGLLRTLRLLRPFGVLLLRLRSRPAALLLPLFVFLVLRVHWYHRSDTQKERCRTRYS